MPLFNWYKKYIENIFSHSTNFYSQFNKLNCSLSISLSFPFKLSAKPQLLLLIFNINLLLLLKKDVFLLLKKIERKLLLKIATNQSSKIRNLSVVLTSKNMSEVHRNLYQKQTIIWYPQYRIVLNLLQK